MHEIGIATELLRQTLAAAAGQGASRVTAVAVDVGVLQQVDHEALRAAFAAVAAETPAATARLDLRAVPAAATCRPCGAAYAPTLGDFACPQCHAADPAFTAGRDIFLMSIECLSTEELKP
jgi:hydrogenase nickel incorporation protein HypA/HybF